MKKSPKSAPSDQTPVRSPNGTQAATPRRQECRSQKGSASAVRGNRPSRSSFGDRSPRPSSSRLGASLALSRLLRWRDRKEKLLPRQDPGRPGRKPVHHRLGYARHEQMQCRDRERYQDRERCKNLLPRSPCRAFGIGQTRVEPRSPPPRYSRDQILAATLVPAPPVPVRNARAPAFRTIALRLRLARSWSYL
jgi:hypothetical protein